MPLKRIVRLDTGVIASGSFADVRYTPEIDLVIKKMVVVEAGGNPLNQVFATLYRMNEPFFHPDVSLALFTPASLHNPELNIELPKGAMLSMRITNNEPTERRVLIHLICE